MEVSDSPSEPRQRADSDRGEDDKPGMASHVTQCYSAVRNRRSGLTGLHYTHRVASERQIKVGNVAIGGGAPVVVQSMTLTKTHDVEATTGQIAALASAGCEIVRVAVPKS